MPRKCSACGELLTNAEKIICRNCKSELIRAENSLLISETKRKFSNNGNIELFRSAFIFKEDNPVRHLIHSLKYENDFRAGIFLGEKITEFHGAEIETFRPDYIVPIPLHPLKKAERGYNQSFYIAKGVAKNLNVPVLNNVLRRKKYTETQTRLSYEERKRNITDAFAVRHKKRITGKRIILVDDVSTTGATSDEAAAALKNAGAEKIMLVTAAIPILP